MQSIWALGWMFQVAAGCQTAGACCGDLGEYKSMESFGFGVETSKSDTVGASIAVPRVLSNLPNMVLKHYISNLPLPQYDMAIVSRLKILQP